MKVTYKLISCFFVLVVLLSNVSFALAAPPPPGAAAITLLNDLPTQLAVGESYVVDVLVESDQPVVMAITLGDAEFPGYLHDRGDTVQRATSAVLHLTLIGARSTADLPGGVTAAGVAVGVRFKGGQLVAQRFPFSVAIN